MMKMGNDFVTVQIVNTKGEFIKNVQMERGVTFQNKGGIYTAGNGNNTITMTNYQLETFEAMADINKENGHEGIVLSKDDIKGAQEKFRNGQFVEYLEASMPAGYDVKNPSLFSAKQQVQMYVTNGNPSQSATLTFGIADSQGNKVSSAASNSGRASQVSKEDMKKLSPSGDGKFTLGDVEHGNGELPIPVTAGNLDDKLAERLKSYEGKEITPDSIDEVINIMLDYENNSTFGVRVPTDGLKPPSLIFDIAQYAEYLKPETIDKLLNTDFVMNNTVNNDHSAEVKNMRTLYNRMTPEQKQKYYAQVFSEYANTESAAYSWQSSGKNLADFVFDTKLSGAAYNQLKSFVAEMNEPGNGIRDTGTECKALINTLAARSQISESQVKELYEAARIN